MNPCDDPIDELLSERLDRRLDDVDEDHVRRHLASCTRCRRIDEQYRAAHATLQPGRDREPPAELGERIALEARITRERERAGPTSSRAWALAAGFAVMSVALTLVERSLQRAPIDDARLVRHLDAALDATRAVPAGSLTLRVLEHLDTSEESR